ncbi:efflux RND transporter periplasmic adaptor subunit [Lusitaniella coriacea LEGE 07157]|uniref:Efflux RND transporter periplasmic adaptor subunit n=1 Tax=Lusitaniella coriacea LEGE 07157 TaxID=945747 RepID=A0A8J7DU19_9CYAN|nr:efflux RND transporter periplasmic adaptor subunit [Lusitaniella coriacea LEGE 07157]
MEFPTVGKSKRPFPWVPALIISGILVLVGGTSVALIKASNPSSEFEELTVPARQEALRADIQATGTVVPFKNVNISPQNSGRLVRLLVEQGDEVKKGQVLAVMENNTIQARGAQAEANYQQALANLKAAQIRIPGEIEQKRSRYLQAQARYRQAQARLQEEAASIPRNMEQIRAQVASAQARYNLAKKRAERNQELVKEGAISLDAFDEAVNKFHLAEADLFEARQRFEQAKGTNTPEIRQLQAALGEAEASIRETKVDFEQRQRSASAEIEQLQAAVKAAAAELQRVQIEFQETGIRAPFAGIVTQRYATEGAFVTPTTSASTSASATSSSILALAQGLEIVAKIPEVDVAQLQPKQPVEITAEAYPEKVFRGVIRRIAPEAIVEQNVTSFEVRIHLLGGHDRLRSGMNVDVTFLGQELDSNVVVPTVAVVTQEGEKGVMVIGDDNKPEFRPVTVGLTLGDQTQILRGLSPGERVFTELPDDGVPNMN